MRKLSPNCVCMIVCHEQSVQCDCMHDTKAVETVARLLHGDPGPRVTPSHLERNGKLDLDTTCRRGKRGTIARCVHDATGGMSVEGAASCRVHQGADGGRQAGWSLGCEPKPRPCAGAQACGSLHRRYLVHAVRVAARRMQSVEHESLEHCTNAACAGTQHVLHVAQQCY